MMNFKKFLTASAAMLALLATILEAKSVERYRHMKERIIEKREGNQTDKSLHKRNHLSRKDDPMGRRRRGFASWNTPQEEYERFAKWQPSAYVLNRPYFIPVYGPSGQIPIYFPPQPYDRNVGLPPDNLNPFRGPPYLPPKRPTVKPTKTTTMKIDNRNPDFEDYDDEARPIWGGVSPKKPAPTTRRPRPQQAPAIIPTRLPRPKSTTETPPLVHQVTGGRNPLSAANADHETAAAIDNIFGSPEEFRPQSPRPFKESPPITSTANIRTTRVPLTTTSVPIMTTKKESLGPSNCVWAVVSCCSTASTSVPEACFEQRGCPGPFWDRSPCESDFAKAAINKALEYYGK